jgi:RNA polymerase sigma factor (sigma-70 family)
MHDQDQKRRLILGNPVNRPITDNLCKSGSERHGRPDEEAHAKSIAELFQEHNRSLIRFLTARLRSAQEAEEVAQEAYVRLLRLDQPGTVSFLRAFLYKTAANLAVDRMRKRGRHSVAAEAGYLDDFRKPPTPDREVESDQEIEHVLRLIEDLPPKCRQAFLLHKIEELEFADVAQRMGLSERMVRIYVIRAILYVRGGLDAADTRQGVSRG